jgi:probable O-glycosylation ligase (exosortase A-associated)
VYGPPGSFIEDNNAFALATVVAIPLLHFLQLQVKTFWLRHALTAIIVLCTVSALGSQSRGGFVALLAMGAVLWLRSPRKTVIAILIVVAALVLLPMMPASWWDRMHTITNYTQDGSAMGRINAWHVAWQTAKHYFFGGGMSYQYDFLFREYGPYESLVRAAHSIYFQVLGNHGFVGLFLYVAIWLSAFRSTAWLRKNGKNHSKTKWARDLGAMAEVSFVGFAAGGSFLSLAYFDLPYDIMVMVVLAREWVERKAWESEPNLAFLESIGLKSAPRLRLARAPSSPRVSLPSTSRSREATKSGTAHQPGR